MGSFISFNSSPDIIIMIKIKEVRWAMPVECMDEKYLPSILSRICF
jgi:hypothetical protein